MPSRLETILLTIIRIALLELALFVVYLWLDGIVGPALRLNLPLSGYISSVCLISEWIFFPIFIVGMLGYAWLTRKRTTARKEIHIAMVKAAAYSPPAMSSAFKPNSIISLAWTMDYKTNVQSYRKSLFSRPPIYVGCILMGMASDLNAYAARFMPPLYSLILLVALFIFGAVFWASFSIWQAKGFLRKTYYFAGDTLSTGMIVDPDGIRAICGANEYSFPWTVISKIRETQGNIEFIGEGTRYCIPSFAFKSTGDASAFAATLQALKKGLTPPAHDWSAYVPQVQTNEGVWPPAPR